MRNVFVYESSEFAHSHFPVRSSRSDIVRSYESHCGATGHVPFQLSEKSTSKPFSALCFSHADRSIEIAIRQRREVTQHGLDNHHVRFSRERCPQDIANDPLMVTSYNKRFFNYRLPESIGSLANRQAAPAFQQVNFLKRENAGNIGNPAK